jgi:amino-acid N-acetyltransferase
MPVLRSATEADASRIRTLLEHEGLPTSDLASAQPEFVVACEGDEVVGVGALQRFGATALLRSVAVRADRRRAGLGRDIVQELEQRARTARITELVLLTQTAATFFERQGYRIVARESAPKAVRSSEEFRSLCPVSAVCMSKSLGTPSRA